MIKRYLAVLVFLCISNAVMAEAWNVDVTATYLNDQNKLVENVPVLSFKVPVDGCVKGIVRTEDMFPTPIVFKQEICVSKTNDRTIFEGWVFAQNRITNSALKDDQRALYYGQPVRFEVDGGFVEFSTGFYTVRAVRTDG